MIFDISKTENSFWSTKEQEFAEAGRNSAEDKALSGFLFWCCLIRLG